MHTALYRKMRPKNFESVIGQIPIITTLQNQLKNETLSHAYLFCGTRGTGKTSTAKIFARAVNCNHSSETGEPCNQCEPCLDILAERNLNVVEIDAASNNGVDNIRDLREEVKYPPSSGKYKVYIIDEVHMLTTAAFNALLKTLEEPPEHIIFILATTDPQKIPATILSRCQRYDFKRVNRQTMCQTLASYMQSEGVKVELSALEYISSVSDGAMRDALSILDQCISLYGNEIISLQNAQSLLGAMDLNSIFLYTDALINKDASKALQIIAQASKEGRDFSRFTADIITHLRNILVASQINEHNEILDYSAETMARFKEQGTRVTPETLVSYIMDMSELQNQLKYSSQERLMLEIFTVKMSAAIKMTECKPVETVDVNEVVRQPMPTESSTVVVDNVDTATGNLLGNKAVVVEVASVEPSNFTDIEDNWNDFCRSIGGLLNSMLSLCKVKSGDGITIACNNNGSLMYIKDHKDKIEKAMKEFFNLPEEPSIVIISDEGYNEASAKTADADEFKDSIQSKVNMQITFE